MAAVNLIAESPRGVEVLLEGVTWRDAYCELFRLTPALDVTYKIFDLESQTLALIIPASRLYCSRPERFHRLHKARKAYELNVAADVSRPAVEVA